MKNGAWLEELMTKHSITQQELGNKIGKTQRVISDWWKNSIPFSVDDPQFDLLAEALGLSVLELFLAMRPDVKIPTIHGNLNAESIEIMEMLDGIDDEVQIALLRINIETTIRAFKYRGNS